MHCPLCGSQLVWEFQLDAYTPDTGVVSATGISCAQCNSRSVALVLAAAPRT